MNRLAALLHFFWPWLEKPSPEQRQADEQRRASDVARISALNIARAPNVALDEIRRLADSEAVRRRGTEQKAATYLPLVAALIPLVLTMVSALWEKKAGSAPVWANMLLLGLAVAYTASAGWWAFRVLKVAVSHEPGLGDFELLLREQHPTAALAGRLLLHTRRNQEGINWKVSCIMMAHEFLLRAFLAFSLLLALNIGWYLAGLLLPSPASRLDSAEDALVAVSRIEALGDKLEAAPAWTVIDDDCRRQNGTRGHAAAEFFAEPASTAQAAPAVLQPQKGETTAMRDVRISCAGRTIARARTWFLPPALSPRQHALPLPLSPESRVHVSLRKFWPPSYPRKAKDPSRLPAILLRQTAIARGADGRVIAVIVTDIGPGPLDLK